MTPTPSPTAEAAGPATAQASATPTAPLVPTPTPEADEAAAIIEIDLGFEAGDPLATASFGVSGVGMAPGTFVSVAVHSTWFVIGSADVAPDGTFELVDLKLPSDLSEGDHTLTVTATGHNGESVEYVIALSVDATATLTAVSDLGITAAGANSLPVTGATVWPTVVVALLLLAVGVALVEAQTLLRPAFARDCDMGSPTLDLPVSLTTRVCDMGSPTLDLPSDLLARLRVQQDRPREG